MKKIFIAGLLTVTALNAYSHGEDKLGPNKGYIKMPGNFHTEVVPDKDGNFKVYLLDINFKNPMVKKSKVAAKLSNGQKKEFECAPQQDYFNCLAKPDDLKNGTLTIVAERDHTKGADAVYTLPLSLKASKPAEKTDDHSGHH